MDNLLSRFLVFIRGKKSTAASIILTTIVFLSTKSIIDNATAEYLATITLLLAFGANYGTARMLRNDDIKESESEIRGLKKEIKTLNE